MKVSLLKSYKPILCFLWQAGLRIYIARRPRPCCNVLGVFAAWLDAWTYLTVFGQKFPWKKTLVDSNALFAEDHRVSNSEPASFLLPLLRDCPHFRFILNSSSCHYRFHYFLWRPPAFLAAWELEISGVHSGHSQLFGINGRTDGRFFSSFSEGGFVKISGWV